ncbi:MAG: hypothetical protein WBZ15_22805 [Mycobacterium sp.]|uniref:hypothetical protein n=1 Tax=Mycobacterium sp. TaxID=1785 RepID=UPI003C65E6C3
MLDPRFRTTSNWLATLAALHFIRELVPRSAATIDPQVVLLENRELLKQLHVIHKVCDSLIERAYGMVLSI